MKIFLTVLGCLFFIGLVFAGQFVSLNNDEVDLRTQVEAVQKDNKNVFDNMWKKIAQVSEVTQAERASLEKIIVGYANARATGKTDNNGTALAVGNWVHEAIPNVDNTTYRNLQNIIVSSRDDFTAHQTQLIDLNRQHDLLLRKFPNNVFFQLLGTKPIVIIVVTSGRSEKAFDSGVDDEVGVFKK